MIGLGQFWATYPKCPKCELDAKDLKFGDKIQRLVIVHYDPPTEFPGVGENVRACERTRIIQAEDTPGGIPNPWHAGTGSVKDVNCDACMATPEYQHGLEIINDDEPVGDTVVLSSGTQAALNRLQPLVRHG